MSLLLISTLDPCARRSLCVWDLRFLEKAPGSSGDASMDIGNPVASRGHSTTLATDSVGARCHWFSEHAAHPSPTHAHSR